MGLHLFYSQDINAHVWNAVLKIINWISCIPVWESSSVSVRIQDKLFFNEKMWNTSEHLKYRGRKKMTFLQQTSKQEPLLFWNKKKYWKDYVDLQLIFIIANLVLKIAIKTSIKDFLPSVA